MSLPAFVILTKEIFKIWSVIWPEGKKQKKQKQNDKEIISYSFGCPVIWVRIPQLIIKFGVKNDDYLFLGDDIKDTHINTNVFVFWTLIIAHKILNFIIT